MEEERMTEIGALPEGLMRLGEQSPAILYYEVLPQRNRTRMTRIGRIFTDTVNPCVSVSSVQSVFYRNPAIINENNKPQMNADERRWILATGFGEITHRKGRKERKAMKQESLRPLRSLRLNAFSSPTHERAPPAVHSRLSGVGGMSMEGRRMVEIGVISEE